MQLITLHQHDDCWKEKFLSEKYILTTTLRNIIYQIHHVGSTAVPDLLAKPIIDITVESHEWPPSEQTIKKLSSLGYENKGEAGVKGRIWFTKGTPREFNLHYCMINSEIVYMQLMFRDALIKDEKLRREYEAIKIRTSPGNDIDSAAYALAKSEIINSITK